MAPPPAPAKPSQTVELARVEIDALLRERSPENLWDALATIEMVQLAEPIDEDQDVDEQVEEEVEEEFEEDVEEEPEDRSPTLELVAVIPIPPCPGKPRFAHGSDVMVAPHLTRRYQRTELSVADILRGVCGKR